MHIYKGILSNMITDEIYIYIILFHLNKQQFTEMVS